MIAVADEVLEQLNYKGTLDDLERLRKLLRTYGRCRSCHGSGTFDHGGGPEVTIEGYCQGMDNPPHRYCPCIPCGATGLEPDVQAALHDTEKRGDDE